MKRHDDHRSPFGVVAFVVAALLPFLFGAVTTATGAGARVSLVAKKPPIQRLIHESWAHLADGDRTTAIKKLQEAHRMLSANPRAFPAPLRHDLDTAIERLSTADGDAATRAASEQLLAALEPIDPLGAKERYFAKRAPSMSAKVRETLASIAGALSRTVPEKVFVSASVKQFGDDFRGGVLLPLLALNKERQMRPSLADMITDWEQTPKEKRVFVIGARSDTQYVRALKTEYAVEGIKLFFYRDCGMPLCSEAAVGAFFGTAGQLIVSNSAAALASSYVTLEVKLTQDLHGTGPSVDIIDAEALQYAVLTGSTSPVMILSRRVACVDKGRNPMSMLGC